MRALIHTGGSSNSSSADDKMCSADMRTETHAEQQHSLVLVYVKYISRIRTARARVCYEYNVAHVSWPDFE